MSDEKSSLEVMPPSATEVIERAEIDSQIATAKRYPRSLDIFKKRAISMAIIDEETAESCLYRRPVGMKDGVQQFAEGMSVRMAEIVGASYGNLRVAATIVEQNERFVRARGMAIDLESNFAASSEVIESTVKRNGQPYDERMRVVIAKACLAKARRDATFQVVPRALAKPVEAEVRKLLLGDTQTLERRRAAVLGWISKLGIDAKRVWAALGIAGEADLGVDKLEHLTGLRTAIKDNEVTIDEAFPDPKVMAQKQGLGEVIGKPAEAAPAAGTSESKPSGAGPTTPPPAAAAKTYTADDRQKILKEVEDLMFAHGVNEAKVLTHAHANKLALEGQDEVSALSTSALDQLLLVIPKLKPKAK